MQYYHIPHCTCDQCLQQFFLKVKIENQILRSKGQERLIFCHLHPNCYFLIVFNQIYTIYFTKKLALLLARVKEFFPQNNLLSS